MLSPNAPGNQRWMIRSVQFTGRRGQFQTGYTGGAINQMHVAHGMAKMGVAFDLWMSWDQTPETHVAQLQNNVLFDRTYTGLATSNALQLTSDQNYVYAIGKNSISGGFCTATINRLPLGHTVWETVLVPAVPSEQRNGPIMHVAQDQNSRPDLPQYLYYSQVEAQSGGRAKRLWRRDVAGEADVPWTISMDIGHGFNPYLTYTNEILAIGDNGILDPVSLFPTLIGRGSDVGTGPDTRQHVSINYGLTFTEHNPPGRDPLRWGNTTRPARLSDGTLVFPLDKTSDGEGFEVTPDSFVWTRLDPNITISSPDNGRQQVGSDGTQIVYTAGGAPRWGTMAGTDWSLITFPAEVASLLGSGQGAILWDPVSANWWLGQEQYLMSFTADFTELTGIWDYSWITGTTQAPAHFIGRLRYTAGRW